jgi:hypothetical protein
MRPPSPTFAVAVAALASTVYLSAPASAQAPVQSDAPATAQADSIPAPARPQIVKHTVKKGDTLWDIAKFYLKDPFKWPEVFHANTDIIKNPHWIYPDQVLVIEGHAVRDEVAAQVDEDGFVARAPSPKGTTVFLTSAPTYTARRSGVLAKPPVYTVREGEYEAAPFVVDSRAPLGAGKIVGAVERPARQLSTEAGFKLYDRLYVTPPQNVTPHIGDVYILARRRGDIPDVGSVIEPTAQLRVDSINDKGLLIGTIVRQYQAVHSNELTIPYDHSFVPTTARPVTGDYGTAAKVLWIPNAPVLPTLQTYVVVQATTAQGVKTGDRFTIYDEPVDAAKGKAAPTATATVQIVRVTPYAATGLIVNQTQPMVAEGMTAKMTAKMP